MFNLPLVPLALLAPFLPCHCILNGLECFTLPAMEDHKVENPPVEDAPKNQIKHSSPSRMKFLSRINGITLVIAALTFLIGWQLGNYQIQVKSQNFVPQVSFQNQEVPDEMKNVDFKLFWDTWDLVSKEYVDKKAVDPQKMFYGAIQGMVSALGDPYTVFLPPEQQKNTQEELGGSFDGVGIQLGFNKDKRLVVITPLKDTPADKAGVKPGDIIVKINGQDSTQMSIPEAVNIIRGEKGTEVSLEIYHEGDEKTKELKLKRDTIIVKSVEFEEKTAPSGKKVAYIKLTRFGERTFDEWNQAVSDTLALGPVGVIVDVRNNPGGYLDGAVFIGSEFIEKGDIVKQEDGKGQQRGYPVSRKGKLLEIPMVVLMNKGSASASEIVSGAIQDYKRGKLIGDQSFGKGTIQDSKELPGGTGIHITTHKWLTPLGRWIHTTGLTPDVKVVPTEEELKDQTKDVQLDAALKELDK
jgi:carboxyl-terminal processing protease